MSNELNNRLVTHEDAVRIISALNAIANRNGRRFNKLTFSTNKVLYDGETHNVSEILDDFNSDFMSLTGDVNVTEEGSYSTTIQFKRGIDEWADGTISQQISWKIVPYSEISWSEGTDAQILAMIAAADRGEIDLTDYWDVGDTRQVQLSAMEATGVKESHVAQTVELVLVAKDTGVNDSSNPCYNYQYVTATSGRTYPSFIVQQKNTFADDFNDPERGKITSAFNNNGGWNGTIRRTWCNSVYKNAMPNSLVGVFKQVKVKAMNGGSQPDVELVESPDYFFLPAEKEIFGSVTRSHETEGNALSIWPYYSTSANRIKYIGFSDSTDMGWWERSTLSKNTNSFCQVSSTGSSSTGSTMMSSGIAPAGCI